MKNKALIVTTTLYMVRQFLQNDIKILQSEGYSVDIATNTENFGMIDSNIIEEFKSKLKDNDINLYQVDFSRNAFDISAHINTYNTIKSILDNGKYQIMHVHTPIAGAIARVAARKNDVKVLYTAHGFHFYKGAPFINWALYYPVEKMCSAFTDTLITINSEDYERANKKMNSKCVEYIPGIGINTSKIYTLDSETMRGKQVELNLDTNAINLFSVGELNKNKNHQIVINAISQINDKNIHYYIAGKGLEKDNLIELADKLKIADRIHFLGFRTDVKELYQLFDIFVFPSFREGLSVSLMEAMASRLPCAVSNIRGNVDLIDEKGGCLFLPNEVSQCKEAIEKLISLDMCEIGRYNAEKVKRFDEKVVQNRMKEIYKNTLS